LQHSLLLTNKHGAVRATPRFLGEMEMKTTLLVAAVLVALLWSALTIDPAPFHFTSRSDEIFSIALLAVFVLGYGLFYLLMWLIPIVAIIGAALLVMAWVRKLVLDAVRESKQ
jgi:hypothetical protein